MASDAFEVTIVGGGPAGAALAWLLAGAGMRTLLVDDGRHHLAAPRETLLAAGRAGLQRAGLWQLAESAAQRDPCRHGAIWGSEELVWRDDGEPGLLLERGPFDARLRKAAAARGAVVLESTSVEGALPGAGAGPVALRGADGRKFTVQTERLVVATGRRPRPELVPLREVARGHQTAALTIVGVAATAAGAAVVEAVPQGWWWWIGDGACGGAATLLCDAAELAEAGSRGLAAAALRAARGPVAQIEDWRLVHGTRATARVLRTTAPVLLLGDAAATIDPLASQGVEKAFAAADHAAAVLLTAREQSAWWPRLLDVHARWEHGLFTAHAAMTAAFLAREQRFLQAPFWRSRLPSGTRSGAPLPNGLLTPAAHVREQVVLARLGERFIEHEGVCDLRNGDTLTHIGYVPVVPLLRSFASPRQLGEGVAAAGRDARLFVLPPRAVHEAASELLRRGWLTPVGDAAASR